MKDKFEEIAHDALHSIEIKPSEGLFQKVMDQRLENQKKTAGIWNSKMLLFLVSGFLVSSWIVVKIISIPVLAEQKELASSIVEPIQGREKSPASYISNISKEEIAESKWNDSPSFKRLNEPTKIIQNKKEELDENSAILSGAFPQDDLNQFVAFKPFYTPFLLKLKSMRKLMGLTHSFENHPVQAAFFSLENTPGLIKRVGASKGKKQKRIEEVSVGLLAGTGWVKEESNNLRTNKYDEKDAFWKGVFVKSAIRINDNVKLISGLHYMERHTRYEYASTEIQESTQIDTVTGYILNPGAPPILITKYDTTILKSQIDRNGKGQNTFTYLSIPLGVSYVLQAANMQYYIQAGTLIGISFRTKGSWMAEEAFEPEYLQGKSKQYISTTPLGYFGNIGVKRAINNHFLWYAEGAFNSFAYSQTPLGQSKRGFWLGLGASAGIAYKF